MANSPAPALRLFEGDESELYRWTRAVLVKRARIVLASGGKREHADR